ncbi:MAG TPA: hypothetical protein PK313_16105, partial [Myxococcota bacterium]|nr:hypothetical protein [Myxococcota bacterium]
MVIGLLIAIAGALLGIVGSLAIDWVDADVVSFAAPSMYQGFQWWTGAVAIILMAVALALAVVALFVTRKKFVALLALLATSASFVFLFLTPFSILGTIHEAIAAKAMAETTGIAMYYGYHLGFFGILITVVGLVWTLVTQPMLGPEDRLLRVALLWDGKLIKETTFTERRDIVVGDALRSDFVVPNASPSGSLTLFKIDRKGEYSVALSREMDGRVNLEGVVAPVREFVKKHLSDGGGTHYVPLKKGDWGVLNFENKIEVFFQFVRPDVIIGRSTAGSMDGNSIAATIGSAFVLLSFW